MTTSQLCVQTEMWRLERSQPQPIMQTK